MANQTDKELSGVVRRILGDIRVELTDEFDRNFERQGFFTEGWKRRKSPTRGDGHILVNSGRLRRRIKSRSDATSITFYSTSPYAAIHNEGGAIKVTARMKRFFWAKYREATGSFSYRKNGGLRNTKRQRQLSANAKFYKAMALKKEGSAIEMPRRQFLGMAPEVEREVTKIIEDDLQEYFDHLDLGKR